MTEVTFRIWRGESDTGHFEEYETEISDGMVVLDAIHDIQAKQAPDIVKAMERSGFGKNVTEEMKKLAAKFKKKVKDGEAQADEKRGYNTKGCNKIMCSHFVLFSSKICKMNFRGMLQMIPGLRFWFVG